ncbi:MAG: DMT family transporter [Flavobacteriales bacterium]|nr:DMT family transporter [Flavobacteriales bacterium]
MVLVIMAAATAAGMFLVLKGFQRWKVDTRGGIVVNYLTAAALAWWSGDVPPIERTSVVLPYATVIGVAFIVVFFVAALSTQHAGVQATTVASKMSLIIPVLAAVMWHGDRPGVLGWSGIALALVGVVLATWSRTGVVDPAARWLPLVLFFAFGTIDAGVSAIQHTLLHPGEESFFALLTFSTSAICGLLWAAVASFRRSLGSWRTWGGGMLLGTVNFLALWTLLLALAEGRFGASFLFPLVNIGVVLFSVIGAVLLFQERPAIVQRIGIGVSILSLVLILWSAG